MALHLIHRATPTLLSRARPLITHGDAVVFLHSESSTQSDWLASLPASVKFYVLDSKGIHPISIDELVTLTTNHTPIVSWF